MACNEENTSATNTSGQSVVEGTRGAQGDPGPAGPKGDTRPSGQAGLFQSSPAAPEDMGSGSAGMRRDPI